MKYLHDALVDQFEIGLLGGQPMTLFGHSIRLDTLKNRPLKFYQSEHRERKKTHTALRFSLFRSRFD
jgi:hypothetical protein